MALLVGCSDSTEPEPPDPAPTIRFMIHANPGCQDANRGYAIVNDRSGAVVDWTAWSGQANFELRRPDTDEGFAYTIMWDSDTDTLRLATWNASSGTVGATSWAPACLGGRGTATLTFADIPAHESYIVSSPGSRRTGEGLASSLSYMLEASPTDAFLALRRADAPSLGLWVPGLEAGEERALDLSAAEALMPVSVTLDAAGRDLECWIDLAPDQSIEPAAMILTHQAFPGQPPATLDLEYPSASVPLATVFQITHADHDDLVARHVSRAVPPTADLSWRGSLTGATATVDSIRIEPATAHDWVQTDWSLVADRDYFWFCDAGAGFGTYSLPSLPPEILSEYPGLDRSSFMLLSLGFGDRDETDGSSDTWVRNLAEPAAGAAGTMPRWDHAAWLGGERP